MRDSEELMKWSNQLRRPQMWLSEGPLPATVDSEELSEDLTG